MQTFERRGASAREKGYIGDPVNKNKSVWLSDEGQASSKELFYKRFGKEK